MRKMLAAVATLLFLAAPAAAQATQEAVPAVPGVSAIGAPTIVTVTPKTSTISLSPAFAEWLQPYIDQAIDLLIVAFVGWLGKRYHDATGKDLDQAHRDALKTFLQNEASSLIADGLVKVENGKVQVSSADLAHVWNSAQMLIPAAAKHFGITPDYVAKRVVDTIPQVAAGAQMIAQSAISSSTSSLSKLP
jgi:hypothetical protein